MRDEHNDIIGDMSTKRHQLTVLDVFETIPSFDLEEAIHETATNGYYFGTEVVSKHTCEALADEADGIDMVLDDRVGSPINKDAANEITQLHKRARFAVGSVEVPVATTVSEAATIKVHRVANLIFPELKKWSPTEASYQRYAGSDHHIGIHRDQLSDQYLGLTITVAGIARVLIHQTLDDPNDYTNTRVIDEYRTTPGSAMFLRASGLSNGERVLHEVQPPDNGQRLVLNLRMRAARQPSKGT